MFIVFEGWIRNAVSQKLVTAANRSLYSGLHPNSLRLRFLLYFGAVLIWDYFQPVSLAVNLIQLNKRGGYLPVEQIFL